MLLSYFFIFFSFELVVEKQYSYLREYLAQSNSSLIIYTSSLRDESIAWTLLNLKKRGVSVKLFLPCQPKLSPLLENLRRRQVKIFFDTTLAPFDFNLVLIDDSTVLFPSFALDGNIKSKDYLLLLKSESLALRLKEHLSQFNNSFISDEGRSDLKKENKEYVYISKGGKRYHKKDCPRIRNKEVEKILRRVAVEKGYSPCKVCGLK